MTDKERNLYRATGLTFDNPKFNYKQKELIINEIEEADEYFINILEEKIING